MEKKSLITTNRDISEGELIQLINNNNELKNILRIKNLKRKYLFQIN